MIDYRVLPHCAQGDISSKPFHHFFLDDGSVWTEFYRTDYGYLLRFPGLADFEVSADGRAIVARPAEGADANTIEHLYINQLVPLALSRQGKPAFHASAVCVCPVARWRSSAERAAASQRWQRLSRWGIPRS